MRATVICAAPQDILELQSPQPFAVTADLQFLGRSVYDLAGLVDVGPGVGFDLLGRQYRACLVLSRRIADAGGVIADDQHGLVAEVLELADLTQHDGVAQVDVRCGGVQPQLDAELPAGLGGLGEPLPQLRLAVNRLASSRQRLDLTIQFLLAQLVHGAVSLSAEKPFCNRRRSFDLTVELAPRRSCP